MLTRKVIGATAADVPIEYVGGYTEGFVGITSDQTITFGGNLTGGLDSSASEGDLVLVWFATGSGADRDLVVAGYTEVTELYSNDFYDTNLVVAYKFMGATPDTTFTLTGGTFGTLEAGAVVVQVFRNVDVNFTFDGDATTATSTNSGFADPPSITPSTVGAWVVSGGAGGHVAGAAISYSSSDLTNFLSISSNDTYDVIVGAGYHEWTSGAFDPAVFTASGDLSNDGYSWTAATLALRPVYPGPVPVFIESASTATPGTASTITVSKPTGVVEGDLMVAVMNAGSGANSFTWTGDTGWTEVADQNAPSNLRVAYKVAGASEGSSYTFTFNSALYELVGAIVAYSAAAYDTVGTITDGTDFGGVGGSEAPYDLTASSITVADGAVVLAVFCDAQSPTYTTPPGFALIAEAGPSSANNPTLKVFSSGPTPSGATGTVTSTLGIDARNPSAVLVSIKPA